jgi:hypothetical protein
MQRTAGASAASDKNVSLELIYANAGISGRLQGCLMGVDYEPA